MDPSVALPILLALIALLGLSLLDEPQRPRVRNDLLDPEHADDEPIDSAGPLPAAPCTALDELDVALAALGVDITHLDTRTPRDRPETWEVDWPDDGHLDVDLPGRSHEDERVLVPTG